MTTNNSPSPIPMRDFKAISDRLGGPAKSCRFIVRILPEGTVLRNIGSSGIDRDLIYLCEAAEYPGRGFENASIRYYGPSFKMPFQSNYEDVNLTFICRNDSKERKFFDDWQASIHPNNSFNFNYRNSYSATIDIFQIDEFGESKYHFSLKQAFPLLVNAQPLTWSDDQFLRLGVSFTYTWWTRPGMDKVPKAQSPGAQFLASISNSGAGGSAAP
jgi:hypothetical protein